MGIVACPWGLVPRSWEPGESVSALRLRRSSLSLRFGGQKEKVAYTTSTKPWPMVIQQGSSSKKNQCRVLSLLFPAGSIPCVFEAFFRPGARRTNQRRGVEQKYVNTTISSTVVWFDFKEMGDKNRTSDQTKSCIDDLLSGRSDE